jgi:lipoate-protein ligase A
VQIMRSQSTYKVPLGKLLKISLEFDEKNNVIRNIRITGDFFAYPEEAIELLETKLRNTVIEKELLQEKISSIITQYHIQFIGVNAEGLTQGILMCKP